jgi:hypothetical protein
LWPQVRVGPASDRSRPCALGVLVEMWASKPSRQVATVDQRHVLKLADRDIVTARFVDTWMIGAPPSAAVGELSRVTPAQKDAALTWEEHLSVSMRGRSIGRISMRTQLLTMRGHKANRVGRSQAEGVELPGAVLGHRSRHVLRRVARAAPYSPRVPGIFRAGAAGRSNPCTWAGLRRCQSWLGVRVSTPVDN